MARWNRSQVLGDLHESGINLATKEIFFSDCLTHEENHGITYQTYLKFLKNLRYLESISPDPILIHLSSTGGEYGSSFAIYDAIQNCANYVAILGYGEILSNGGLILQAADRRILMPNSWLMLHFGQLQTNNNQAAIKSFMKINDKLSDKYLDVHIEKCENGEIFKGKTREYVRKKLRGEMVEKQDFYLWAEESVAWGLADGIFGEGKFVNLEKIRQV